MYIDEPGSTQPVDPATVGLGMVVGSSMAEFVMSAARGEFAVNERGGDALLTAIRNLVEWIDGEGTKLDRLREIAKLGSSNNAEIMKPYLHQVATDERGFLTRLAQLRDSLAHAEGAIKQAMANYRANEEQIEANLKGQHP